MAQVAIPEILYSKELVEGQSYTSADFPAETTKIGLTLGNVIVSPRLDKNGKKVTDEQGNIRYYDGKVRGVLAKIINSTATLPVNDTVNTSVPFVWHEAAILEWNSNMTLTVYGNGTIVCAKLVTA